MQFISLKHERRAKSLSFPIGIEKHLLKLTPIHDFLTLNKLKIKESLLNGFL